MDEAEVGVIEAGQQMSFSQRLTGIFFEPGKTFADVNRKPAWLGVFLILAVLMIPFTYVMLTHVDTTAQLRRTLESRGVAQDQIEQQIRVTTALTQSPIYRYGVSAASPAITLVTYIIIASVFLLVFIILGAPVTFRKSLAATFWSFFPQSIVMMILSLAIMLIKNEPITDPQNILMSHLGFLIDRKANPALASLMSSIDIFSLWTISLLSIGFAAISDGKMTTKKAAVGVIALWALYVVGKVGFTAIFS
jgi:hypothetical protein